MLKLATLIANPGEPRVETQYHDPNLLASLGYTGRVFYETTAHSGIASYDGVTSGEMRAWLEHSADQLRRDIAAARLAGLKVYLCYDAMVLPAAAVHEAGHTVTCRSRPGIICPGSEEAWVHAVGGVEAMLRRFPDVDGIVLRVGDTDAARLPHLVGNDIYAPYCPRCSHLGRADRIVDAVARFYDAVVTRGQRTLIARAWNVRPRGWHDTPELAERVTAGLTERLGRDATAGNDPRMILSFKFTETDFWRYQRWNASSLRCGDWPVMYELQCQREFEGKGGVPNWQAALWRDGYPETAETSELSGLAAAAERVNLAGVWAWVRGGGWGGPYIKHEAWIDANVYAAPRLADDLSADIDALARGWVTDRLGVTDPAAASALHAVLTGSAEAVRGAFYIGPYARQKQNPWHPASDWIEDDVLDAEAAWRMVQRLPDAALDDVVEEKRVAAATAERDRHALHVLNAGKDRAKVEPLLNTLMYAESFYEALRDLLGGLVGCRRHDRGRAPEGDRVRQYLFEAQAAWNHHVQRFGSLPGTATPFREHGFWDLTQRLLDRVA